MKQELKFKIIKEYGSVQAYCKAQGYTRQYLYRELNKPGNTKVIKRVADSLAIKPIEYNFYF